MNVASRRADRLTPADIGFVLGPRLNAAGRLEDMSLGIRCLLATDETEALEFAKQLDQINRQRRQIEASMREEADAKVGALLASDDKADLPDGICLYDPGWHQGVVGLVASRIKERWNRPVVAFADAGDGELRGSARSIPGLHLRDALAAIDTRLPGLLKRFGGHAMAAGMSSGSRPP